MRSLVRLGLLVATLAGVARAGEVVREVRVHGNRAGDEAAIPTLATFGAIATLGALTAGFLRLAVTAATLAALALGITVDELLLIYRGIDKQGLCTLEDREQRQVQMTRAELLERGKPTFVKFQQQLQEEGSEISNQQAGGSM